MGSTTNAASLTRVSELVSAGDYYTAQQTCLAAHTRFLRRNLLDEALDLLFGGAALLSAAAKYSEALDLAKALLKCCDERAVVQTPSLLARIFVVLDALAPAKKEFTEAAHQAVRWAAKSAPADAALRHHVGLAFAQLNEPAEAVKNLMRGTIESTESLAVQLISAALEDGQTNEQAFSRITIPLLTYIRDLAFGHANHFLIEFLKLVDCIEPSAKIRALPTTATECNSFQFYKYPVLNFCQLVFHSAMRGESASGIFGLLRQKYLHNQSSPNSGRHEVDNLLDSIGSAVFGIKQIAKHDANPLQGLMSMFQGM